MTDIEYAWRLGYDKCMEVAEVGASNILASELHPPIDMTDEEKVAWCQGWDDASDSLRVLAWKSSNQLLLLIQFAGILYKKVGRKGWSMNIVSGKLLKQESIELLEKTYRAKYICDSTVKSKGDWLNRPVAIFHQGKAHPNGSNYFGIYFVEDTSYITDAITATEPFDGLLLEDGSVMYSRYRHDFFEHDGIFVDGGREYLRCGGFDLAKTKTVKLQIVGDKLEVVEEDK